jgi:hypothetical protein
MFTLDQTTWFYGITRQGLSKWVERGFPKSIRNQYPLKAGFDWWRNNIIVENGDTSLAEEKLRYQRARSEREELAVLELRGDLIRVDKVQNDLSFVFNGLKQRILSWAKSLPGILANKDERECFKILIDETHFVLEELSGGIKRIANWHSKSKKPRLH